MQLDEESLTQGSLEKVSGFLLLALGSQVDTLLGTERERGCVDIAVWTLRFQRH